MPVDPGLKSPLHTSLVYLDLPDLEPLVGFVVLM